MGSNPRMKSAATFHKPMQKRGIQNMKSKLFGPGFAIVLLASAGFAQTTVTTQNPTGSNYIPMFSTSSKVTNSPIYSNSGNIGIGTTSAAASFQITNNAQLKMIMQLT